MSLGGGGGGAFRTQGPDRRRPQRGNSFCRVRGISATKRHPKSLRGGKRKSIELQSSLSQPTTEDKGGGGCLLVGGERALEGTRGVASASRVQGRHRNQRKKRVLTEEVLRKRGRPVTFSERGFPADQENKHHVLGRQRGGKCTDGRCGTCGREEGQVSRSLRGGQARTPR